ncbi:hypothetical protein CFAM422_010197 [Trichoderma lentiforme]|uniref:Protein kinase domain-containing protein n=1 Tax=Trichoderma lentiforme TaxID=1567552 RepID=A0A9P4X8D1_9HYPO|nr:hypothetical protein CFAM422_010197 [Trichoderma lentiforme]
MASHPAQNLEPTSILAAVAELGVGGNGAFIDGEFNGGECRIFKISFNGQTSIAVRVPHQVDDQDDIIAIVQTEVRILQKLDEKGFRWSPRCCGFSLTFDNPIKYPFIILTWVEGSPLTWDDNFPLQLLRGALLDQIASIQLSLITCTQENRSTSAATFFQRRMKNRSTQVREGIIPGLSEEDCISQQALVCRVLGQDQHDTAFAVEHGDIKPNNIIVDENYNIKCIIGSVIDWGCATFVPISKAAGLPRFLWSSDTDPAGVAPSQSLLKDIRAYIAYFSSQTLPMALSMPHLNNTEDMYFRNLCLESTSSKQVHVSMARAGWKLPYSELLKDAEDHE